MGGCRCSFRNCTNATNTAPGMHFFHFPFRHKERCERWAHFSNNMPFLDLTIDKIRNKVVCGEHFKEKCFMNSNKERLTKNAVPTLTKSLHGEIIDLEEATKIVLNQINPVGLTDEKTSKFKTEYAYEIEVTPELSSTNSIKSINSISEVGTKLLNGNMKMLNCASNSKTTISRDINLINVTNLKKLKRIKPILLKNCSSETTQAAKKPKLMENKFHSRVSSNNKMENIIYSEDGQTDIIGIPDEIDIHVINETSNEPEQHTIQKTQPTTETKQNENESKVEIEKQKSIILSQSIEIESLQNEILKLKNDLEKHKQNHEKTVNELNEKISEANFAVANAETTVTNLNNKILNQQQQQQQRPRIVSQTKSMPLSKLQLFNGVRRYLNPSMVALLRMELFGDPEREYKPDEKEFAMELLKISTQSEEDNGEGSEGNHKKMKLYDYMRSEWRFRLPPKNDVNNWIEETLRNQDNEEIEEWEEC